MEALVAWLEGRKKHAPFLTAVVILGIILLPRGLRDIWLIIGGLLWHLWSAETASAFWLELGFSPEHSQAFAISGGMLISFALCKIGLSLKSLPLLRTHRWLASHPQVAKRPYLGIIILGILLPTGGVVAGIFIARSTDLKKLPAILTILTVNLIKLLGWGKAVVFLFLHLGPSLR